MVNAGKRSRLRRIEAFDVITWLLLGIAALMIIIPLYHSEHEQKRQLSG